MEKSSEKHFSASGPVNSAYEVLKKNVIFSPLSDDVLQAIWRAGTHEEYAEGEKLNMETPSVQFLNLILRGEMRVHRVTPDHQESLRITGPGFSYGSIDRVLGTGKFLSAMVMKSCAVFTLHRNDLSSLLRQFPELTRRLSQVRMAVALRVAKEVERKIKKDPDDSRDLPRIAPRFPLYGRTLVAVLQDGTSLRVQDISDSGLFVLGEVKESVGQDLCFTVKDKQGRFDSVDVCGQISRKTDLGFGLKVGNLSPVTLASWEQILTEVLTVEVEAIFKPDLKRIHRGCMLKISSGGEKLKGKVFSLGVEGAICQIFSPLERRVFDAQLSFESVGGESERIPLEIEIIERRQDHYLVRFMELSLEGERKIADFIAGSGTSQIPTAKQVENSPVTESDEKKKALPIFKRMIPNSVELCRFYFRELSDQIIILPGPLPTKIGSEVSVSIELSSDALPVSRSQNTFLVSGKVVREKGNDPIVELNMDALPVIARLKQLSAQVSQRKTEQTFYRAARQEHDVKYRRYIQLILVLFLLAACIWWARDRLLQGMVS